MHISRQITEPSWMAIVLWVSMMSGCDANSPHDPDSDEQTDSDTNIPLDSDPNTVIDGDCTKLTLRDSAYAFKLRIRDTSGYFKVNVGTGPTHGNCPDYRVNYIGSRILQQSTTPFSSLRWEACFILGDRDGNSEFVGEWDVVVPFVPESGLEFAVHPGNSGEVEVSLVDFDDKVWLSQTFTEESSFIATPKQLPPPGGLASQIPAKPVIAPKMGAYYFPWYATPDGDQERWVHWNPDEPELYMPQLDYYDCGDPEVIRQHMEWALDANLNLLVISYWDQEFSRENTSAILEGAHEAGIEISAMIETTSRRDGSPRENLLAQFQEILNLYVDHPAWLKAQGVPIVFVYGRVDDELNGFDDWLWVRDNLDSELIIMYPIEDDTQPEQIAAMGGGFAFAANSGASSTWTGSHSAAWNWTWTTTQMGGLSALPILPSFKEIRTEAHETNYRNQWRAARNSMPDMIIVNSWNEYHESTIIEPTEQFGNQYLLNTAEEAGRFCNGMLGDLHLD